MTCTTCHTAAPALNPYGVDIQSNLLPGEPRPLSSALFTNNLADALAAVEDLDSDGDGYDNLTEIQAGSAPADSSTARRFSDMAEESPPWMLVLVPE